MWLKELGGSVGVSFQGTNLVQEGSTLMTYSPTKASLLNTIMLSIKFQHMNFGKHKHSVCSRWITHFGISLVSY